MNRGATAALAAAAALLACLVVPGVAAAAPGWSVLPDPLAASGSLAAVSTFGDAGLVVAGAGAAVAVSGDGGATWTDVSASGLTSQTLSGVAFTDGEHGVAVGPAGTILFATPDGLGVAWTAATLPADVTGDLRDVAMRGTVGYAVGTGGVILRTSDGGASWEHEISPTTADLNAVAISADGDFAAAVGTQGTLLVNQTGSWETRESGLANGGLRDVALPAAAGTVYYCSADQVFSQQGAAAGTTLPAPSLPTGDSVSSLALVETATVSRLVAGGSGGWLAGIATDGTAWKTQTGGTSDVTALAVGDGGLCYATTVAGRVERSLSAGRAYTISLTATPSASGSSTYKAIVTMGAKVALSGSMTNVLAPGVLLLQARPAGTTSWLTLATEGAGTTTLSETDYPVTNTTYRLRFLYAGASAATSSLVPVGVRHKVRVSSTAITLALTTEYQVSGSVAPAKTGGVVEVWSDRAGNRKLGPWHRIPVGGYVDLADGTRFTTRSFGTPVRETYHLKVLMRADSEHLKGWSPRITVTVR